MVSRRKSSQEFFPIFLSLGILSMAVSFYAITGGVFNLSRSNVETQVLGAGTEKVEYRATLRVVADAKIRTYKNVPFLEGSNVYDFLLAATENSGFSFASTNYSFGQYVHTVNGYKAGADEYWKVSVNGTEVSSVDDDYEVKENDVVGLEAEDL